MSSSGREAEPAPPESQAFDPTSGGCHFLLSDGKSEDESYLVDASANGRDVFFSTRQSLVGWDANDNYDVYDAREGGGFPEPGTGTDLRGRSLQAAGERGAVLRRDHRTSKAPATPTKRRIGPESRTGPKRWPTSTRSATAEPTTSRRAGR